MVKSGGFIAGIASILDLPEATITGAFRALRVNGLMTTGARGVNAPEMSDLDAARMLIAMLVNERPAQAENSVRDFGQLVCVDFRPAKNTGDRLKDNQVSHSVHFNLTDRGLAKNHTLEQAVAELIRMVGDDEGEDYWVKSRIVGALRTFEPLIEIEVWPSALSARIIMNGNEYDYCDTMVDLSQYGDLLDPANTSALLAAEEAHIAKKSRYSTVIQSVRSVRIDQLFQLAELIRRVDTDQDITAD